MRKLPRASNHRRGAITVLAAFLMVVLLAFAALAIDLGYMSLVKTQLQLAADSAALAGAVEMTNPNKAISEAKKFAAYNSTAGKNAQVLLSNSDIEFGTWDIPNSKFTPTGTQIGNALRVTARRDNTTGNNGLFFARVWRKNSFNVSASAVAVANPRDICLVVDLSGSMNNDTEPGYTGTGAITGTYASIRTQMMTNLFSDFGFGSYPGTQQSIGQPLGASNYSNLIASGGPLTKSTIPTQYRILSGDSTATKKQKAYKWMMDYQIAAIMPQAKPAAVSSNTASYNYWTAYLDTISSQSSSSQFIGYRTYIQFCMDNGREVRPNGTDYTQMSINSPLCPYHTESVGAYTFSFPPREMPTHACRRSLIAAIDEIKEKNKNIPDGNQRDWVSIVTFDTVAGTTLLFPLSSNYDAAMQACTKLQATSDVSSTATETGLISAYNHMRSPSQGGSGRTYAQKVVVLLTDGMPTLKTSSDTAVSNYRKDHPNSNFYGGSSYYQDAALMQTNVMQGANWQLFGLAIGLGADYDFMDRMARMGSTQDDSGKAPRTSGDPSAYEVELRSIFNKIVNGGRVHLVY